MAWEWLRGCAQRLVISGVKSRGSQVSREVGGESPTDSMRPTLFNILNKDVGSGTVKLDQFMTSKLLKGLENLC